MKLLDAKVDFMSVHQWQYFSWSEDENIVGGPGVTEPKTISRDLKQLAQKTGREGCSLAWRPIELLTPLCNGDTPKALLAKAFSTRLWPGI